jgi:hypothetical protein
MRYHWLTFETLEPGNRDAVMGNIPRMQIHALNTALVLAENVGLALRQKDFRKLRPIQVSVEETIETPPPAPVAPST